jgi:DNA-directed RNA polymerase subunit RPC12/RpoP
MVYIQTYLCTNCGKQFRSVIFPLTDKEVELYASQVLNCPVCKSKMTLDIHLMDDNLFDTVKSKLSMAIKFAGYDIGSLTIDNISIDLNALIYAGFCGNLHLKWDGDPESSYAFHPLESKITHFTKKKTIITEEQ